MTDEALRQRNEEELGTCWPAFATKVKAIIADMAGHGFRCRIQQAWRSPQEQMQAFSSGHSKLRYGFHNVTGSGGHKEALAVDMLDDDHPNQETAKYSLLLYACAEAHGLTTGGTWGLDSNLKRGFLEAYLQKKWDALVKIGWDNCHIEPKSITPQDAKNGKRI